MSVEKKREDISSEKPYQPRSFWEKIDRESWRYFLLLTIVAIGFTAAFVHGFVILFTQELPNDLLFQLLFGIVALWLCLLRIGGYFFEEIERIDGSI